MLAERVP